MRNIFIIVILMCSFFLSRGQDSLVYKKDVTRREQISSTSSKTQNTDTLSQQHPSETLKYSKWNVKTANQKYDSIQKITGNQNKLTTITDSVMQLVNKPIDIINRATDTLHQKVNTYVSKKSDSLEQKLNKPLDKLNSKVSVVTNPLEQKADSVTNVVDQKVGKLQTDVQRSVDKLTDGSVKMPSQDRGISDLNLPQTESHIPGIDISNPNAPGLNGDMPNLDVAKESLDLPGLSLNADQLKEKANLKIPDMDKVNDLKGKKGMIDSKLAEGSQYGKDLQGLAKGDSASVAQVEKKAEEKIMSSKHVKGFEDQTKVLTKQQREYRAMAEKYKDKKLLQQEISRKSKNVVNEKINQFTPEVKDGMSQLNKDKRLEAVKNALKKKSNRMAGKPVGQRIIPGVTLQAYKREVFQLDAGVQLGYRLTGRLRVGAGGVYRFGFSESYPTFVKRSNIYGWRAYAEFLIRKGIYLHAEYEHLNATGNPASEVKQKIPAAYVGLGKQFNISGKVKGHTLVLYRMELARHLQDQSRINLRLGFDLRTDKKRRRY